MNTIKKKIYGLRPLYDNRVVDVGISPYSESYDWVLIGDMISGRIPANKDVLNSPIISFEKRKQRNRDCILFSNWMLISDRTLDVLELVIGEPIERATWLFDNMPYHLLMPSIHDYLDKKASEYIMFPSNKNKIMEISKYVFRKELIADPSVFRIPECRTSILTTECVRETFEKSDLIGFDFVDYENPPPDALIA